MKENKTKIKNMKDLVDRVTVLTAEIKVRQEELDRLISIPLNSTQINEKTPEPEGFDYKEAILKFFTERSDSIFKIDDVVKSLSETYKFSLDREITSLRIAYLADSAEKLERIEGKRGFYRLRKTTEGKGS